MIKNFICNGPPVPAARMTRGTIWTDRSQNYLGYKDHLMAALQLIYPNLILHSPHPSQKKERAKFLKEHKGIIYSLVVNVYEEREKGDADNYLKTVQDALQGADIIPNDRKIKAALVHLYVDPVRPRIEIKELRKHVLSEKADQIEPLVAQLRMEV